MKLAYSYKDFEVVEKLPLSIKDFDGKKGIVTGYFASFDTIDSDGDVIKKGAFARTISQNGPSSGSPRIKHLLNHDSWQPLGKLMTLQEDSHGLAYESQLGTHNLGVDFVKMVDSGLITEHSIGYQTIKYNQIKPWSEWKQGEAARELTELKLWEGSSLTAWGANQYTPLTGLKRADHINKISNRIDLMCKALRNGTFTDETFDLLEIELRQLQQAFNDISEQATSDPGKTTPDPAKSTMPMNQVMCPNCKAMTDDDPDDAGMINCKKCGSQFTKSAPYKSRKFNDLLQFLN